MPNLLFNVILSDRKQHKTKHSISLSPVTHPLVQNVFHHYPISPIGLIEHYIPQKVGFRMTPSVKRSKRAPNWPPLSFTSNYNCTIVDQDPYTPYYASRDRAGSSFSAKLFCSLVFRRLWFYHAVASPTNPLHQILMMMDAVFLLMNYYLPRNSTLQERLYDLFPHIRIK